MNLIKIDQVLCFLKSPIPYIKDIGCDSNFQVKMKLIVQYGTVLYKCCKRYVPHVPLMQVSVLYFNLSYFSSHMHSG